MLTWGGGWGTDLSKNRWEPQWSPLMRTQASEDSGALGDSALDSTFLHADWDRNNLLWSVQPFVLPNQTANTAVTPRFRKTGLTRCFSTQPGPWKPSHLLPCRLERETGTPWVFLDCFLSWELVTCTNWHMRPSYYRPSGTVFPMSKDEFLSLIALSTFST